jgi:RNA polymerase sigma-70 factor, ECF subfamily
MAVDKTPVEHAIVSPASVTDAALVAAFHAMRDELVSTLVYILHQREAAEDAAQETFIKCWKHREAIGGVSNLRAWIFRVGLNTAKDVRRSAWNRKARALAGEEANVMSQTSSAHALLEHREELQHLQQAILELREDEKEVFLLRQNGELTYEQIAEIRKIPVGTVKTQMRAALQKLRTRLA